MYVRILLSFSWAYFLSPTIRVVTLQESKLVCNFHFMFIGFEISNFLKTKIMNAIFPGITQQIFYFVISNWNEKNRSFGGGGDFGIPVDYDMGTFCLKKYTIPYTSHTIILKNDFL